MIFHENRLPADDSHEISCLICYFWKSDKIWNCRLQIIGGALRVKLVPLNMFKPSRIFLLTVLLLWIIFVIFVSYLSCYAVLAVSCSLVVTCWKRVDLLALLYVAFSCIFVTFQYGFPYEVWNLIVSTPDLCLPLYFF